MTFLDDARAETGRAGGKCSVGALLGSVSADERADIEHALGVDSLQSSAIARALVKRGHRIQAQTVARHRNKECSC